MTQITTTTTEERVGHISGILDEMVRHIEEKEALPKDFGDVLPLPLPRRG